MNRCSHGLVAHLPARQAARSELLNAVETKISLAALILEVVHREVPNLFGDFEVTPSSTTPAPPPPNSTWCSQTEPRP